MSKKISFQFARNKLITLWLIMSLVIVGVFLFQTIAGRLVNHSKDIWQWLFQFISPSITLMLGIYIAQGVAINNKIQISRFVFRLAFAISFFFLAMLFFSAVAVPLIHISINSNLPIGQQKNIMDAFKSYDYFLLPLQGLTMLSLGLFFAKNSG